jgi:hypothetical protein
MIWVHRHGQVPSADIQAATATRTTLPTSYQTNTNQNNPEKSGFFVAI